MAAPLEVVLCQNLAFVRWLVARVVASGSDANRQPFVDELAAAVDARAEAIERGVLPALRDHGGRFDPARVLAAHLALGSDLRRWRRDRSAGRAGSAWLRERLAGADRALLEETETLEAAARAHLAPCERARCSASVHATLAHRGSCASVTGRPQQGRCCPARDGLIAACPAQDPASAPS